MLLTYVCENYHKVKFIRQKLAKIAKHSDHNIDPWNQLHTYARVGTSECVQQAAAGVPMLVFANKF
jgi:hypothetical protein